jgi:tetratricopeptide (TPR) repeat protein
MDQYLSGPDTVDQADARRRVRFELIAFLLTHDQTSRALSELLAMNTDLPDDLALRLEVGQLFAKAGDHGHALDQFQRALRVAPGSHEALAGAGEAAFQLGDYALARTYLRQLPAEVNDVRDTRDLVELVLSNDPLAKRIGSAERRRRLAADFSYAEQRVSTCLGQRTNGQLTDEELALQTEVRAFEKALKPGAILEQDTVETGVDLIDRMERRIVQLCGPLTTFDHALALIGSKHGAGAR